MQRQEDSVPMWVVGIFLDSATQVPIAVLSTTREGAQDEREIPRYLAIWIGQLEAAALALELQETKPSRPLTHDLLSKMIAELGGSLTKVEIAALIENTYSALLHVNVSGKPRATFDCTPSDALILALKHRLPVHVYASLLDTAPQTSAKEAATFTGDTPKDRVLEALRKMRPEDFKYKT